MNVRTALSKVFSLSAKTLFLIGLVVVPVALIAPTEDPGHATIRFLLHVAVSPTIYLILQFVFWALERKVNWWPETRGWWTLLIPSIAVLLIIPFNEFWNVAQLIHGAFKAQSDYLSWAYGVGGIAWAQYRFHPRLDRAVREIKRRRRYR